MIIYRNKINKLLYTIEEVSPRAYTGSWHEAKPYNHSIPVYKRRKHVDLKDFEVVAER